MDLFDYMRETAQEKEAPLASRMRPVSLDQVVGQQHIIGKDKLLYRAMRNHRAAVGARPGTHFDYPVGNAENLRVVVHEHY